MVAPLLPLITPCTFCAAATPRSSGNAAKESMARNTILPVLRLFMIVHSLHALAQSSAFEGHSTSPTGCRHSSRRVDSEPILMWRSIRAITPGPARGNSFVLDRFCAYGFGTVSVKTNGRLHVSWSGTHETASAAPSLSLRRSLPERKMGDEHTTKKCLVHRRN